MLRPVPKCVNGAEGLGLEVNQMVLERLNQCSNPLDKILRSA
jgi:hypothetical protein